MATVNEEISEWIRVLREQWLTPVDQGWGFGRRFFCALVGSLSVFMLVAFSRLVTWLDLALEDFSNYGPILGLALVISFLVAVWFAWLVSWKDFGYGPVRLYFSGIVLPTLAWLIVSRVFGLE